MALSRSERGTAEIAPGRDCAQALAARKRRPMIESGKYFARVVSRRLIRCEISISASAAA